MFTIIELFKGFKGLSRIGIDELTVQLYWGHCLKLRSKENSYTRDITRHFFDGETTTTTTIKRNDKL